MDLKEVIEHLYAERERLERVIAALEELHRKGGVPSAKKASGRRGRKSMEARERQEVSERMKRYWASRRKEEGEGNGATT